MAQRLATVLVFAASLAACSTIVGADFDDRHEQGANGGTSSQGGASGTSSGGSDQSGGKSSGGAPANGGSSNAGGAGDGGANGGTNSGGRSSAGGTVALAGAGGASAGEGGAAGAEPGGAGVGASGGVGGEAGFGGLGGVGGSSDGGGAGAPPTGAPDVVLNEVKGQGSGDDYIELFNRGTAALDLEGYGISDESNTFIFPAGARLEPNEFLLLLLGQIAVGGSYTCFTPHPCYHATWGVSQKGENVYFRGRQNQVIDTTLYPDQGSSSGLTNEQTWGRYPNGTGSFVATQRTPEATNLLP
jgi:hypothetical protein